MIDSLGKTLLEKERLLRWWFCWQMSVEKGCTTVRATLASHNTCSVTEYLTVLTVTMNATAVRTLFFFCLCTTQSRFYNHKWCMFMCVCVCFGEEDCTCRQVCGKELPLSGGAGVCGDKAGVWRPPRLSRYVRWKQLRWVLFWVHIYSNPPSVSFVPHPPFLDQICHTPLTLGNWWISSCGFW